MACGNARGPRHCDTPTTPRLEEQDTSVALYLADALLLALVVLEVLQYRRKPAVVERVVYQPAPQHAAFHDVELHKAHRKCAVCGLVVARYDERGVCANCVSEGK